jgi:hypothetical protein
MLSRLTLVSLANTGFILYNIKTDKDYTAVNVVNMQHRIILDER